MTFENNVPSISSKRIDKDPFGNSYAEGVLHCPHCGSSDHIQLTTIDVNMSGRKACDLRMCCEECEGSFWLTVEQNTADMMLTTEREQVHVSIARMTND